MLPVLAEPMHRLVVVGNSGSGKSTLAARLVGASDLPHLDLDTLAWELEPPPRRAAIERSAGAIERFLDAARGAWIVEGCYADLAALILPRCTRLVWLDPSVEDCLANALARPWEPHKYASKEAQDANLDMLLGWIRDYDARTDACSRAAHAALYDAFAGSKVRLRTREEIATFAP